jgi:hypothetical protein
MDYLEKIESSGVVGEEGLSRLAKIKDKVLHAYTHKQMWRTKTEMGLILNPIKFPTDDSKYWQAIREQSVFFENLIQLSFDYRKNDIEIRKLQKQLAYEDDELEKELIQIQIEEKQWAKIEMERQANHRIRELVQWQEIKDGLNLKYSPDDVNQHQAESYYIRHLRQESVMGNNGSPPERWNLIGQRLQGQETLKELGTYNEVLKENGMEVSECQNDMLNS